MLEKGERIEQIWLLLFIVVPLVMYAPLSELFVFEGVTKMLTSGFFGIIAATGGFFLYNLTKSNNNIIKLLVLLSIVFFALLLIYYYDLFHFSELYSIQN